MPLATITDPTGIIGVIFLVAVALLLVEVDQYVDRRQQRARRNQAHERRKAGRW